ncbi:MAG: hypothetical protein GX369_01895 [Euryarchaeota archaeon]|nr:hypothetical protein [Euryarchaeota archaeon]
MRRRARFRGVKKTPKSLEKDILERSRRLADDPKLLMPECARNCRRCPIRTSVEKMHKVSANKNDPKKLDFAMKWGDQLVRAYAATISLAESGKVPYLAAARTPMGEVSYAVRGKVERDVLIGVQNFDDPEFRLMAFWKIAKRKRLHIYSMENHAYCSPDGPNPPSQYVKEALALLPYELDDKGQCPHPDAIEHLKIRWRSADTTVSICSECATDTNIIHTLASRIAASDPIDDFEAEVSFQLRGEHLDLNQELTISTDILAQYRRGDLTDTDLLKKNASERLKMIQDSGKEIYIIGDRCLGEDRSTFLANLRGGDAEIEAISGFLSKHPMAIVTRSDQAANLLADLWEEYSEELLAQVTSPEVLEDILKSDRQLTPAQTIAEAKKLERAKGIISQLPQYVNLGPAAAHADKLARLYLVEGKASVSRYVKKSRGINHSLRSISYAFLMATEEASSMSWQFTREEMDFGNYLTPFVRRLISSVGDEYHEALSLLMEASGSGEKPLQA